MDKSCETSVPSPLPSNDVSDLPASDQAEFLLSAMHQLAVTDDAKRRQKNSESSFRFSSVAAVALAGVTISLLVRALMGYDVLANCFLTVALLISSIRMARNAKRYSRSVRLEKSLLNLSSYDLRSYLHVRASIEGVSMRFEDLMKKAQLDLRDQYQRFTSMLFLSAGLLFLIAPVSISFAVLLGVAVLAQAAGSAYTALKMKDRLHRFRSVLNSDNSIGRARAIVDKEYGTFDSFVRVEVSTSIFSNEEGVNEPATLTQAVVLGEVEDYLSSCDSPAVENVATAIFPSDTAPVGFQEQSLEAAREMDLEMVFAMDLEEVASPDEAIEAVEEKSSVIAASVEPIAVEPIDTASISMPVPSLVAPSASSSSSGFTHFENRARPRRL